ncbi:MAG: DNA translocase FtsK 4TM domain-containing protein [Planctomycetes bacterium]|nr:DNA translocase FtsK 4TM domain-containing protein [Planctomycetota bacterium]
MSKNKPKSRNRKAPPAARPPGRPAADAPRPAGRFWKYCAVLALIGAAALAWISLLSYCPTDPPSTVMVAPHRPVANVAGIVGAYLAYAMRYWLGVGCYMALLFATVAGLLLAFGGRLGDLPWRLIGVAVLVTATSAAVYMWNPAEAGDPLRGSAGILGIAVGELLLSRFAAVGGWIILLVSLAIGLMLTADNLVLKIPSLGRRLWRQRGRLAAAAARGSAGGPAAAAQAGQKRPIPVPAGPAGKGAARPSLVRRMLSGGKADRAEPPGAAVQAAAAARPVAAKATTAATAGGSRREVRPTRRSGPPGGKRPYELPAMDLLARPTGGYLQSQEQVAAERRVILQQTLNDFNVAAEVLGHQTGPVITLFELALSPGVKVAQVANLAKDIARALAVPGVRVVSPLPGRDTIGIEVPNPDKEIVRIRELMELAPDADGKMHLPLYFGKDVAGNPIVADLAAMPHMLIAGTTGSGKSVCINSIIMAMLMTRRPEDVRLILVDPKMVEMAAFEDIPHLLCPIVNDMRRAEDILEWAATKMDERYELFKEVGVRNIAAFNRLGPEEIYRRLGAEGDQDRARVVTHIPYYVIIVDELADLIMTSSKEVENHIIRIAQKARAVGIHLILATQRPSVNVVTGLIKSNMPCRVSFRVASRQESRIVLDQNGAEVLLGQGDMLFLKPGTSTLVRAQGTFVDDTEIRSVVAELRKTGKPQYDDELTKLSAKPLGEAGSERDELFDKAVEIVLTSQRGSVSLLQRRLAIGYSRASRIIDQMAEAGILGDYKGSQARECLLSLEEWHALQESIQADQSGASALNGEPTSA